MKKWIRALCVLAVMMLLAGCGTSFKPTVTSLYIHKNGKITQAIVESFEKEYYSLTEFESMLQKEMDTYNQKFGEERIKKDSLEIKNDTLYLLLEYEDADTFSQYNEEYCFVGSVEEAEEAGLSFNMVFKDADYEEYTAEEAARGEDSVAVLKEEGVVQLQKPVKYVSNNVEIIDEHTVQVMPIADEDEYAYIIY